MAHTVLFIWQDMRENEMPWTESLAHVHYRGFISKIGPQESNQETDHRDGGAFSPYRKQYCCNLE